MSIKNNLKNQRGFVALISTIIISAILLLIATNLSLTSFYNRSSILDFEFKEKSFALAEACVDTAILRLANNSGYIGDESITVSGSDVCNIQTINSSTNPIIINTKAVFRDATTKLKIKLDKASFSVVYFEEIP